MQELRLYIKRKKISYVFLSEETGYSKTYLSRVFNGHRIPSLKFEKLLILALSKYARRDLNDLEKTLEGTRWQQVLLSF